MKKVVLLFVLLLGLATAPSGAAAAPYALDTVSSGVVVAGGSVAVYGNNFKPGSTVTVRLVGGDGTVIGSLQANSSGVVSGRVSIPAGIPVGSYTLQLTGPRPSGGSITLTFPITVAETAPLSESAVGPSATIFTDDPTAPAAGGGATLPATGSDTGSTVAIGAGLLGLGAVALVGARLGRRRAPLQPI